MLYDLSSSYFEGTTCPLAKLGHNRDGKKGLLQVNYGLLTDARGCPVAVSVHEGNVADSATFMPEVQRLRDQFGIELSAPEYPGERLVACRNPQLAALRAHKRQELLAATEKNLQAIKARVDAGRLAGADAIGLRVGKVVNQYKVAKHFELAIGDKSFTFARKQDAITAEAALDGIYIIRTSLDAQRMDAPDCVRNYKALANVERAFRSLKTVDLKVRPIHHRTADRVRAHILLCMLAHYVEWHMRQAWAPFRTQSSGADAPTFEVVTAPNVKQRQALELIQHIRL